jgi:hypothetical protein
MIPPGDSLASLQGGAITLICRASRRLQTGPGGRLHGLAPRQPVHPAGCQDTRGPLGHSPHWASTAALLHCTLSLPSGAARRALGRHWVVEWHSCRAAEAQCTALHCTALHCTALHWRAEAASTRGRERRQAASWGLPSSCPARGARRPLCTVHCALCMRWDGCWLAQQIEKQLHGYDGWNSSLGENARLEIVGHDPPPPSLPGPCLQPVWAEGLA